MSEPESNQVTLFGKVFQDQINMNFSFRFADLFKLFNLWMTTPTASHYLPAVWVLITSSIPLSFSGSLSWSRGTTDQILQVYRSFYSSPWSSQWHRTRPTMGCLSACYANTSQPDEHDDSVQEGGVWLKSWQLGEELTINISRYKVSYFQSLFL